jgi:UDP-N-acetylglucosamine 2-epimerase (non-hydrolysing)
VTSGAAAALASAKLKIPVVHIEGGVRSPHLYNPEEVNRRVTDVVSKLIFASTRNDYATLLREDFSPDAVCLSGDLMKDSLLLTLVEEQIESRASDYVVATIHRDENVQSPRRLTAIVDGLIACAIDVRFPVHPRTRQKLEHYGLFARLSGSRVKLLEPTGYVTFVRMLAGARRVLTDSGGVRREAYILGKPVIVPTDIVWFPEIVESGWMVTVDADPTAIAQLLREFTPTTPRPSIFGDGNARHVIADRILRTFE